MDRKLYDAAVTGNVDSLLESLQEDAALLNRIVASYAKETPLHTAALCGHLQFARELLNRKPELARQRNSQGFSPLHLASAKGDLEMVKELLPLIPDISLDRDRQGRSPLHAAVIKGHIHIVNEFIRLKPDCVRDLTGRGETALHLCVKYDQLEMLMILVGVTGNEDFVSHQDENGNTILHLATSMKHIPVMRFLLSNTEVKVNEINSRGQTALDLLDVEMEEKLLLQKGAKRSSEITSGPIIQQDPPGMQQPNVSPSRSTVDGSAGADELRPAVMVVSALVATVSFQAGLNPPGGLWQDDKDGKHGHQAGSSILAGKYPIWFTAFSIANTVAFMTSAFVLENSVGRGTLPWFGDLKTNFSISLFSLGAIFLSSAERLVPNPSMALSLGLLAACLLPFAIKRISKLITCVKEKTKREPTTDESPP